MPSEWPFPPREAPEDLRPLSQRETLLVIAWQLENARFALATAYRLSVGLPPGTQEAACDVLRMHLKETIRTMLDAAETAAEGRDTGMFAAAPLTESPSHE